MSDVFLCDYSANCNDYSGAALTKFFATTSVLVINNGTPDTTPPTVTSGKILTPTVHLSATGPVFIAQLGVADDLSGVETACVSVDAPGLQYGGCYGNASSPVFSGTIFNRNYMGGATAGTGKITGYAVCDVAGNCATDSNEADIKKLFGTTTFKLVQ